MATKLALPKKKNLKIMWERCNETMSISPVEWINMAGWAPRVKENYIGKSATGNDANTGVSQ